MKTFLILLAGVILMGYSAYADYSLPSYGGGAFVPFGSTKVTIPKVLTESVTQPAKSAEGSYTSIIGVLFPGCWLFSFGDAGIESIAKKANITAMHHVDEVTERVQIILPLYEVKKYRVYGS